MSHPGRKLNIPDIRSRSMNPTVSAFEPALLDARWGTPEDLAFCPSCKTLAYLFHPPAERMSNILSSNQAFGHHTSSEVQQATQCELCLLSSSPDDRRVAVLAGLLWFIILSPESTLTQSALNQHLWGVVRSGDADWASLDHDQPTTLPAELGEAAKTRRIIAREQLLAQLAITPETRTASMPHEIFTEPEAALVEQFIRDRTGAMSYRNLSAENRHALYASIGVDLLIREQRPTWRGRELFFLTDIGVEALASEPTIPLHAKGA